MQSKKSCFNKTIFLKNLTRFAPVWIAYFIALLIANVVSMYGNIAWITVKNGYKPKEIIAAKAENITQALNQSMNPLLILIFAMAAAICVFSYLHIQRSCNTIHAWPVTRMELFVTNYVSGLTILLVPTFLSWLAMIGLCAANDYPYMGLLAFYLLQAVVVTLLFYSMAVLTCMVTGVVFAAPVYYLVLNWLVVGVRYIIASLIMSLCYGLSGSMNQRDTDSIFSPYYYIRNHILIDYEYIKGTLSNVKASGYKVLAIYAAVAVIFLVISVILYKKRHLENVGKLITVSWIQPIFRWGVAICVSFWACMLLTERLYMSNRTATQFVICMVVLVIVGAVSFFIVEMFLRKKVKVFTKKKFLEFICYLAVVLGFAVLLESDSFGLERKLPEESEIQYASIYASYQIADDTKETIDTILGIHKELIEQKAENEAYYSLDDGETYNVTISYKLKNGSTITRNYEIPSSLNYMENEDSVANQIVALSRNEKNFLQSTLCRNYEDISYIGGSIDLYNEKLEGNNPTLTSEDAEKIMEAYLKDLEEGNLDSTLWYSYSEESNEITYYNSIYLNFTCMNGANDIYSWMNSFEESADREIGYYSKSSSCSLNITSRCANTIQVLKETGVLDNGYRLMTNEEYNQLSDAIYGN